jgi:hypothetical protein
LQFGASSGFKPGMTLDPANPVAVRDLLLTLSGQADELPYDIFIEGPLHARKGGLPGPGTAPLPASHPRTFIYQGRSDSSPYPFAIKIYELASALNTSDWIRHEATVLARLQKAAGSQVAQPLAGRLHAFDADKGVVVSEWIGGGNLRNWLTTFGRLPGARARGVAAAGQWLAAYNRTMSGAPGKANARAEVAIARDVYCASGVVMNAVPGLLDCLDEAAARLEGETCLIASRHGDFSPNNLLMPGKAGGLRAIDFSLPVPAPVAQDAAQFLINRSVRLAADIRHAGPGARAWRDWAAYRALAAGYGAAAAEGAFPAHLLSLYALVWCVRRIIGLELTSRQASRTWYDRLDRKRELARHLRLAQVFVRHLERL